MRTPRLLVGAITVGAFAVASLFAAAPASAAPLPAGQKITVVETHDGQFSFANNETAALTPVGPGNSAELDDEYATAVDVDDDGLGYAISTYYPEGADGASLYTADANTGLLTYVDSVVFLFGDALAYPDECTGLDWTNGQLTIACTFYGELPYSTVIGVYDFDAEAFVPVVELNGDPMVSPGEENPNEPEDSFDYMPVQALAVDPATGVIYIAAGEFGTWAFYTVSQDAGATFVSSTGNYVLDGADFDRDGKLWATTYRANPIGRAIEPDEDGLAVFDLATGLPTFTAAWANQGETYQAPLTVWGRAPELAATGPADLGAPAVAAALLLLSGAILAGVTAVRRQRLAVHAE